jgi:hypothetical protein
LLLISKSMFTGVSQYAHTVSILYFGLFSHFHYSHLPLNLPLSIKNNLWQSTHLVCARPWIQSPATEKNRKKKKKPTVFLRECWFNQQQIYFSEINSL